MGTANVLSLDRIYETIGQDKTATQILNQMLNYCRNMVRSTTEIRNHSFLSFVLSQENHSANAVLVLQTIKMRNEDEQLHLLSPVLHEVIFM